MPIFKNTQVDMHNLHTQIKNVLGFIALVRNFQKHGLLLQNRIFQPFWNHFFLVTWYFK
jgi:hypothetical protein